MAQVRFQAANLVSPGIEIKEYFRRLSIYFIPRAIQGISKCDLWVKTFDPTLPLLPTAVNTPTLFLPVKCCHLAIAIPGSQCPGNRGAISIEASSTVKSSTVELWCAPF